MTAIGHLGKDCLVNQVNGKNVMNFSVAHSEKYKDNQGVQKERTIWVDCAYWSDRVAIAPYLKKGTNVYVEGQPDVRAYTTQDGRNLATLTLRVATVQLLGSKSQDGEAGSNEQTAQPNANYNTTSPAPSVVNTPTDVTDDLPF